MNLDLQSPEIKDIATALAKAQSQIENALKDSKNPHFKSKFASLASVINAVSEQLSANGIAVTQSMLPGQLHMPHMVVTTLSHTSGQWIRSFTPLILTKNDMQGLGSAITYARRYALSAIVGITQEDDDGHDASTPSASKDSKETKPDTKSIVSNDSQSKLTFDDVVTAGKAKKWQRGDIEQVAWEVLGAESEKDLKSTDLVKLLQWVKKGTPDQFWSWFSKQPPGSV